MTLEIKKEVQDEILDFIKMKTGAAAVDVVCLTSQIPCQEEVMGIGCLSEHMSDEFGYGIAPAYLATFHIQLATNMDVGDIETEDQDD